MTAHAPAFREAVAHTARRIQTIMPPDLAIKFRDAAGITANDFRACPTIPSGRVCAIDGSNALILESGSLGIALFRAAQSTFFHQQRAGRSLSPIRFSLIGPGAENEDFPALYEECFGEAPGTPLGNEDRVKTSGVLRDTLEYWVMEQMAGTLHAEAILIRDGPLRVSHASHDPVLTRIVETCAAREISLAGVSKRTSATWGGGYPLIPSLQGAADTIGIVPPWWVRIDPSILDHFQYSQWRHGEMYIACLHPRARSPLKIELAHDLPEPKVQEIMGRLAACSGDGRIPGYPYPLLDAHRTVVLTDEIIGQARSDLMRCIASAGIGYRTCEILFGDYHDEFARY